MPEWVQEFQYGLVDESVPEHRDTSSSSHEFPLEPRAKVVLGSGKHSVRKQRGLLAADELVQWCGTRFGNAVVTIVHLQNRNYPGDPEEPNEVPGADEETKTHLH